MNDMTRPTQLMPAPEAMPDVQGFRDERRLAIQRVGVKDVRYPIVLRVAGDVQPSVAMWDLDVALPADQKGTHMSRFVAWLNEHHQHPLEAEGLRSALANMLDLLHADTGRIEARFSFFTRKTAPVSGVQSLLDYEVQWIARAQGDRVEFELVVQVPVTSLCPCSKAISEYGAHNQRSHVTVSAILESDIGMDGVIRLIEDEGSCELWGLLKRPDEKFVTERAYDNPKFVEDLVRDVAARLNAHPGIARYRVEAENFESIHNHSAYAVVEG